MSTMMDYDYEHWMLDEGDQELFSSFPLLDQKAHSDIQDGVELSDLITPAGNLLDQLDAMYPTDTEVFPEWMSEKMSFNFLEELSSDTSPDSPAALLPFEKTMEEQQEKPELTDLDILHQLVNHSTNEPLQPTEGAVHDNAPVVTELTSDAVDDELWEALSAASGLSSPSSFNDGSGLASPASSDMSFLEGSPASTEDMDVFTAGSPASAENVAVLPQPIVIFTQVTNPVSIPTAQSKPVEVKQPKSKARSIIKTANGTVKPSRRERKKDQNKQAATRYREKKRSQSMAINIELEGLEKRNVELKDTVESMTKEIKYLKDLLQEVMTVKGQLKDMGHTKKYNK